MIPTSRFPLKINSRLLKIVHLRDCSAKPAGFNCFFGTVFFFFFSLFRIYSVSKIIILTCLLPKQVQLSVEDRVDRSLFQARFSHFFFASDSSRQHKRYTAVMATPAASQHRLVRATPHVAGAAKEGRACLVLCVSFSSELGCSESAYLISCESAVLHRNNWISF